MSSLRQKILERMEELGHSPKKSLGQNFLISQHVVDRIVEAVKSVECDQVIEIGPGLGSLTDKLLQEDFPLILMELDRGFAEYWESHCQAKVMSVDALKAPWSQVLKNHKTVLVSNLPYQISSRIVIDLSIANPSPQRMVLMFQKEVAKRIVAQAGSPDYSLLSFVSQVFWQPNLLLEAGSVDFYPKPNVASRVITFDRKILMSEEQQRAILDFAKLCFEQKKKMLKKRLIEVYGAEAVKQAMISLKLAEGIRVGQMPPYQLLDLFTALTGISLDPASKTH